MSTHKKYLPTTMRYQELFKMHFQSHIYSQYGRRGLRAVVTAMVIVLVILGDHVVIGCTDRQSFVLLNQVLGNCTDHIKKHRISIICEHPELRALCCKSCRDLARYTLDESLSYELETFFVLDNYAFKKYMAEEEPCGKEAAEASVKADIDYFITEINKRFESLLPIKIKLRKKRLKIFTEGYSDIYDKSHISNVKLRQNINAGQAIASFDKWLDVGSYKHKINYDVAVLWTGYDIYRNISEGSTVGIASTKSVCSRTQSSAVVEYSGIYDVVTTTAHELGHILGMKHDASGDHIMAPSSSARSSNRWTFSAASRNYVRKNLRDIQGGCLLTRNGNSTVPNSAGPTPRLKDPNSICRRAVGPHSFLYHEENRPPKGDYLCKAIKCYVGHTKRKRPQVAWWFQVATDGMVCGSGRRCREGTCQVDSRVSGETLDDDCLFGDMHKFVRFIDEPEKTCPQHIHDNGAAEICGNPVWFAKCCHSCGRLKDESSTECPYGEHRVEMNGKLLSCAEQFDRFPSQKQTLCGLKKFKTSCSCSCSSPVFALPDPCVGINCNNKGNCSGGVCSCQEGYTGAYCLEAPPGHAAPTSCNGGQGNNCTGWECGLGRQLVGASGGGITGIGTGNEGRTQNENENEKTIPSHTGTSAAAVATALTTTTSKKNIKKNISSGATTDISINNKIIFLLFVVSVVMILYW